MLVFGGPGPLTLSFLLGASLRSTLAQEVFAPPSVPSTLRFHWYNFIELPTADGNYTTEGAMITGVQFTTQPNLPDVEGVVVHFNASHLTQLKTKAPWIAFFPCDITTPSELLTGVIELGARAVLTYSANDTQCPVPFTVPPSEIPVFLVQAVSANDVIPLFDHSNVDYYNATMLDIMAESIQQDLDALNTGERESSGAAAPGSLMRTASLIGRFFVSKSSDNDATAVIDPPPPTGTDSSEPQSTSTDTQSDNPSSGLPSISLARPGVLIAVFVASSFLLALC